MPTAASRVLAMLELLQAQRRMTVGALAARLAVDERTVRRYAGTLAELGIPVTAERGRHGGYRLLPGFKLPPLMLTDDEAVAVVLGLMAADRIGLSAQTPAAAAAEAKITRVLPRALAERLAALRSSLGFTMPEAARERELPGATGVPERDTPDTGLLLTLGAATRAGERLTITYRNRRQDVGDRRIDPYGLVFHSGRWYVVAHDHRRGEIRSFRADRIAAVAGTGETFAPPPGFDAVEHLNRQWATRDYQWQVEVLLEAEFPIVRRRVPASVAELTEEPGGVRMRCRAHQLTGMAQMLAGLGWPFTVVRPDELRAAVAEHAARLTAYSMRRPEGGPP
jgi:predicted DNA-binding transcriptional regulator YafY